MKFYSTKFSDEGKFSSEEKTATTKKLEGDGEVAELQFREKNKTISETSFSKKYSFFS